MLWTLKRYGAFRKARKRWRSWRLPVSWTVDARDLPIESSRRWMFRLYAREFYSCLPGWVARWVYPDKGILLGRAFRWSPAHTQELETHLQGGKSLPVGWDMRGVIRPCTPLARRKNGRWCCPGASSSVMC